MTGYSLAVSSSARRELKRLPATIVQRLSTVITPLSEQPRPHGCRKLKGEENTYRLRVGDYRIIYEVSDSIRAILITRVRHRSEAYEE